MQSLGTEWYHSVMQNWDHLHNSHTKWYHSVTETLGPFYTTDCGNDITVLRRMLGPFTQQPRKMVLQCSANFGTIYMTGRGMVSQCYAKLADHLQNGLGKWYHSVMQNLWTIYTTPRRNGNAVLHKLEDHLHNAPGKWYHTVRQNLGTIYTTPYVSPKMRSVWSQAAEHASVTWTKHGPEVWCHHHSERVVCLLGFQTTALRARQQMASNKCKLHSALLWSQGKRSSHLSLVQMTPVSQCSWNSIIMHLFVQNINKQKNVHVHCLSYSWNRISASRWSEIVFLLCLYVRS